MLNHHLHAAPAPLRPTRARGGIVLPLILLAIGIFCITFPDTILDSPSYAKLPKRSFAAALGLLFVAGAIGAHAHEYWGRRGYVRVSHFGRLIGGIVAIGAFAYLFKCIIEVDGLPW